MNIKTKQAVSIVLSLVGSAGVILTMYLTREAALKEKKDGTNEKNKFKNIIKNYKLPLTVAAATIASTVTSTILSKKAEASLGAMTILASQGYNKYKDQVKEVLGFDKHVDIIRGVASEKLNSIYKSDKESLKKQKEEHEKVQPEPLYYEEHIGYFRASEINLLTAYSNLNQRLHTEGGKHSGYFARFYDFVKDADAVIIDKQKNQNYGLNWGWHMPYLSVYYLSTWVHMNLTTSWVEELNENVTIITWDEEPIPDADISSSNLRDGLIQSENDNSKILNKFKPFKIKERK